MQTCFIVLQINVLVNVYIIDSINSSFAVAAAGGGGLYL